MAQPLNFNHLFEIYKSSALEKNVDSMMSIYDADIVGFDMWGAWSLSGEDSWRKMNQEWLGSLGSESVLVEFGEITAFYGNDISAAHATIKYAALSQDGSVLRSMQNRLTWVARCKNGAWKIIHQHTSAPIDPKTMGAILQR